LSAIFVAGLLIRIFLPLRGKYEMNINFAPPASQVTLSEVEGERAVNKKGNLIFRTTVVLRNFK